MSAWTWPARNLRRFDRWVSGVIDPRGDYHQKPKKEGRPHSTSAKRDPVNPPAPTRLVPLTPKLEAKDEELAEESELLPFAEDAVDISEPVNPPLDRSDEIKTRFEGGAFLRARDMTDEEREKLKEMFKHDAAGGRMLSIPASGPTIEPSAFAEEYSELLSENEEEREELRDLYEEELAELHDLQDKEVDDLHREYGLTSISRDATPHWTSSYGGEDDRDDDYVYELPSLDQPYGLARQEAAEYLAEVAGVEFGPSLKISLPIVIRCAVEEAYQREDKFKTAEKVLACVAILTGATAAPMMSVEAIGGAYGPEFEAPVEKPEP